MLFNFNIMTEFNSKPEPYKNVNRWNIKQWIRGKSRMRQSIIHEKNADVESTYKKVLELAKQLYSSLPDPSERTVFEKDDRRDCSENPYSMHTFINSSFYWYLECNMVFNYRIEYDLHNCPFQEQFMELIESQNKYNPGSCIHWHQKPNCKEFFQRVIKVQDAQFIYVLPHIAINS